MEDFRGIRSYSCTRMIPCCSHIPHFHHTPSQFYIRWYLQAKLDIWTIGLIEWQAVKFPLSLLNFAEEKNTIGPSGEPHMTLTNRRLLSSLELYYEVTSERTITEYLKQRKILVGGLWLLQLHRSSRKKIQGSTGVKAMEVKVADFHLHRSE